jgi:L-asparaginase type I
MSSPASASSSASSSPPSTLFGNATHSIPHKRFQRQRSPGPASLTAAEQQIDVSSVLCLYVGGTVGMVPTTRGLEPKSGFLAECLAKRRAFHDKSQPLFTTPVTRLGGRIHYEIREYCPLLDSSNMNATHWARIANDIRDAYDRYDAFVVLHGTDTMCYTASALSFMLMNLGKTVILTGSAIPLAYEPNDASDNIGGALLIAGHFDIPEVTIFFRDQLFRGNRCTKINAAGLDAFNSGNCAPLAQVGIQINVRWDIVRTPAETQSALGFRVLSGMEPNVGVLTLFPNILPRLIRQFLAPPLLGCVMQTFGSGNIPDDPEIVAALEEACARGVIIVNITQCFTGTVVHGQYSVSALLDRIGVLPGFDLTREAALTKLAYLLSRYRGDVVRVRESMVRSLRGELTEPDNSRRSWRKDGRTSARRTTSRRSEQSAEMPSDDADEATTAANANSVAAVDSAALFAPAVSSDSAVAPAAAVNEDANLSMDMLRGQLEALSLSSESIGRGGLHSSMASPMRDDEFPVQSPPIAATRRGSATIEQDSGHVTVTQYALPTLPDAVQIGVRATDALAAILKFDPNRAIPSSNARESKD